jgi:PAS domain S-box-containing protein
MTEIELTLDSFIFLKKHNNAYILYNYINMLVISVVFTKGSVIMADPLYIQHDVAIALSSTNDLQESLNLLLEYTLQLDILDSGAIHFIDEDTGDLEYAASKGFSPEFESYLRSVKKPTPFMNLVMTGKTSIIKGQDIHCSESDEICSSENLGTILFFPIKHNDELIAVMSISSHSADEIPDHIMAILETIIAHMESVIVRTKIETKLNNLLILGELQSEISARFICMESENVDETINHALEKIGEFTEVDDVGIFIFSDNYRYVDETHEWCKDRTHSKKEYFTHLYLGESSWCTKELIKGQPLVLQPIDDLPPEAVLVKKVFHETDTDRLLIIPMMYRETVFGVLCLAYSRPKQWPESYLRIFKLTGETFANALEHKRKDSEIKESENKYRRIFEEIHDVYFETKIDGTIITLSPSVESSFGYKPEELIGSSIMKYYAVPEERQHLLGMLTIAGCLNDYILSLKKKDGSLRQISVNAHLVYGAGGEPERVAGIARDVTEIKNIEKMLIHAKLLLENASRTKSDFLAIVNHELRTPLYHVLGFSEVLLEENAENLAEKQRRYVESIHSAGSKLLDLLTSLNYIAEIEEGKMELEITDFSLVSLIGEVKTITSSIASKKNIGLEFNVSSNIDHTCGDRSKIKIILLNLISNAIKFTPEGGNVYVDVVRDTNQNLSISVQDTGLGISAEHQEMLFKPFVQLEPTLNRKSDGVGLGLALVKEFAKIQGGEISLKSELGKGSTFVITIPDKAHRKSQC